MNLIDYAKQAERPLLVCAHPGSGTGFVVETLKREGFTVHHESIEPIGVQGRDVIVSFRFWPDRPCDWRPADVVQLVRCPMRTVFSMQAISKRRPNFTREVFNTFVPEEMRDKLWKTKNNAPLKAIIASVLGFHARCDGLMMFPVHEIPIADGLESYNSHNTESLGTWEEMRDAHPGFTEALFALSEHMGKEVN